MKEVDVTKWSRVAQYEWFSSFDDPSVGVTSRMDITELLKYCRSNGLSSFAAILYIISRSAEETPAFRYRFIDGKVYDAEKIRAGYTLAVNDSFINAYADLSDSFAEFEATVKRNKENASMEGFNTYNQASNPGDIYATCLPWIDFISVKHPIPHNSDSNSVPRIAWGKYNEEGDRVKLSLNITVSHALVDGKDLGDIFKRIQDYMDNPESILK